MAIHAKINGLLIGGTLVSENDLQWVFHASDCKRPVRINKSSEKSQVFTGESALDNALDWQVKQRKALGMKV